MVMDLECHVGPHHDSKELVALGRAEQQGATFDRVVDGCHVDVVDEPVGKWAFELSRPWLHLRTHD